MDIVQRMTYVGVLLLSAIGTGIWLSHSGRPLSVWILAIHKLVSLTSTIYAAVLVRSLLKTAEIGTSLLTSLVVSGLSVLVLFISGALLSAAKPVNNAGLTLHRVAPALAVTATALAFSILAKNH